MRYQIILFAYISNRAFFLDMSQVITQLCTYQNITFVLLLKVKIKACKLLLMMNLLTVYKYACLKTKQ